MAVRSDGEEPGRTYRLGACCRLRATTRSSTNCDAARHACGFKLANDGHDTRAIQAYLGHRSIMSTVLYGFETKSVQEFLNSGRIEVLSRSITKSSGPVTPSRMVGSNKWPLNFMP
jgi:Phage integrase family